MIQGETPNWEPLEKLLGDDLPGWFMWMFEAKLVELDKVLEEAPW